MAQKFVNLDDAAKQLGISKDRLNELREAGKLRAYRDGISWKFRADDIDKLESDGIPALDASASDIALETEPAADQPAKDAAASDLGLDVGDESPAGPAASDVGLEDLDEPTVPVDLAGDGDDIDELSDSILLSETELGESTDRPPSTIIGKAEMSAELDLELAGGSAATGASDVKLASTASDVLSSGTADKDAVLDVEPPGLSDNFGGLQELEVDLEAESSRIVAPEDVEKAKQAGAAKKQAETSDLGLAPSDSAAAPAASDLGALDSSPGGAGSGGLTGLSALELEGDDDEVLGDGSDITLSSESSGINIISPSDSGLALDEVPLDLSSGVGIGSPLDLGGAADAGDVMLEPLEVAEDEAAAAEGDEPFTLTPFGEEAGEEEEDSSQVIPLDEVSEDDAAGALLGAGAAGGLEDDFAVAGLPGGVMAVSEPVTDTPFPGWVMAMLSICLVTLSLCGIMAFDLLRNMWSWDEPFSLSSGLMESLLSLFG